MCMHMPDPVAGVTSIRGRHWTAIAMNDHADCLTTRTTGTATSLQVKSKIDRG